MFRSQLVAELPYLKSQAATWVSDPSLADDLTQTTLLRAWKYCSRFAPGTDLRSWLFVIMKHCAADQRKQRAIEANMVNELAMLPVPPSDPLQRLQCADVMRIISTLSARQREAVILVGLLGVEYEQVARLHGACVDTVKSRVRRVRQRLSDHAFWR